MKSQKHLLSKLFISTLYLSAFTFGGGYVTVSYTHLLRLSPP